MMRPMTLIKSEGGMMPPRHGGSATLVDLSNPATMRRLIAALRFAFDIRPGIQLPFLLGHGECESNDQALELWILEQVLDDHWVEPGALFNELARRLQRSIKAWRALS